MCSSDLFEENLYNSPEVVQELEQHLFDKGIFVKDGEFEYNNINYTVAHATELSHLREFVTFLRECGGFEIW